jgi:hypothetical protein
VSGFDFPIRRVGEGAERGAPSHSRVRNDHDIRKESKMDKDSKMDLLDGDTVVCINDDVGGFDLPSGRVV